jgi:hypothetical protein
MSDDMEIGESRVLPPEASSDFIPKAPLPANSEGRADYNAAERCTGHWNFGSELGSVQCSFSDGHDGHHYAAGDNHLKLHYRWNKTPSRYLAEKESIQG